MIETILSSSCSNPSRRDTLAMLFHVLTLSSSSYPSTFTADHRAGNCSNRAGKFVESVLCFLFSGDKRGRSKLWREKKKLDDE
ncbi:hypothetical protein P8452_23940 [Trifolium repens]|nr:hypothetical protein P8452_23940 [Trifolium repens]